MVATGYLQGRKKWDRPQAIIFSNVRFRIVEGGYIPPEDANEGTDFMILTDHNRGDLQMNPNRIESRSRMIDGTSRSHHVVDKATLNTSWSQLPGVVATEKLIFDPITGEQVSGGASYVADDSSSAEDMIDWYDTHTGPFWVYLSYEKNGTQMQYIDQKLMYFESFSKTLSKRGLYDIWKIEISLSEV